MIDRIQFMHFLGSQTRYVINIFDVRMIFFQPFFIIGDLTLFKTDDQCPGNTFHELRIIQCIFDQGCLSGIQKARKYIDRGCHLLYLEELLDLLNVDMFTNDCDQTCIGRCTWTDIGIAWDIVKEQPRTICTRDNALGPDNVLTKSSQSSFDLCFTVLIDRFNTNRIKDIIGIYFVFMMVMMMFMFIFTAQMNVIAFS